MKRSLLTCVGDVILTSADLSFNVSVFIDVTLCRGRLTVTKLTLATDNE